MYIYIYIYIYIYTEREDMSSLSLSIYIYIYICRVPVRFLFVCVCCSRMYCFGSMLFTCILFWSTLRKFIADFSQTPVVLVVRCLPLWNCLFLFCPSFSRGELFSVASLSPTVQKASVASAGSRPRYGRFP